jgi:hypothetical protein
MPMPVAMSEESLASAIARLDRAISQIEHAVQQRTADAADAIGAHARLEERHTALRADVQGTISRLDELIAREEGR